MKRYLAGRIARIRAIVFNLGTATIAHPSEVRLHESVGLLIPRIGPMKGGLWEVLTPPDFALDDDRIGVPMLSAGAIRANGMVSAVGSRRGHVVAVSRGTGIRQPRVVSRSAAPDVCHVAHVKNNVHRSGSCTRRVAVGDVSIRRVPECIDIDHEHSTA